MAYEVSAGNTIAYYDAETGNLFKSRSNISIEIDATSFESGIYLVKVDYTVGGWITDRLMIN